ncbi:putative HNHc nuclease [Fructobacillus tropaeoli]|uniref:Phage protein n=1 Tax=Fructobacillus tropaeoli TaxID=709323 RepID=A0A3F3H4J2_9LACO|nr:putative HNHc nuclease [Fructobacillus tropaeoli]GAP05106.1 hypothetical protein FTRO_0510020 [Fructobacillus tropaeoli]
MEITGKLLSRRGNVVTIELAEPEKLVELDKFGSSVVSLLFTDGRSVSPKQRKFARAIMRDIANAAIGGSDADYEQRIYDRFKSDMSTYYGIEDFSMSDSKGNMSDTNVLINMLLEFCLMHNVPLSRRPLDHLDDPAIARYEYACLINKRCVICGIKADHHHITGSKVGMGNDRTKINHRGRRLIALCRQHHDLFHHEEKERMAEYHLQGVPVDEKIAQIYHLNYW